MLKARLTRTTNLTDVHFVIHLILLNFIFVNHASISQRNILILITFLPNKVYTA